MFLASGPVFQSRVCAGATKSSIGFAVLMSLIHHLGPHPNFELIEATRKLISKVRTGRDAWLHPKSTT